jgi:Protein of unknown function (DUF3455)
VNNLKLTYFKLTLFALLIWSFFLFFVQAAHAQTAVTPPVVPDNLKAPAGEVPFLKVSAKGVQIYTCAANATDATKFEWVLKAPEADLINVDGFKTGFHYGGPTWEALDKSKVVGEVKERATAPDGKGIPWLLLKAKSVEGNGVFSKVSSIQRVDTVAGFAPSAADCTQAKKDSEVRVDYTAVYYFYSNLPNVPASGQGGTQSQTNFNQLSLIMVLEVVMLVSLMGMLTLQFFRRKN